jgi:predicted RNA-binding Zn-ribbon protein involved in translation (DUF1610 family)
MNPQTWADLGIALPAGAHGEVDLTCPQCSPTRKKRTARCLSVNTLDERWLCHHCGWAGALGVNGTSYGAPLRQRMAPPPSPQAYTMPKPLPTTPLPDTIIQWFGGRGIPESILIAAGIRWAEGAILFPYSRDGTLVNVKHRTLEKRFWMVAGAQRILYGLDDLRGAETMVVVEGEIDKLSIDTAGGPPAASVPDGAPPPDARHYASKFSFLDETVMARLRAARTVLIGTDMDAPGQKLADELARRIGSARCKRVSWRPYKDANELLIAQGPTAVLNALATAQPYPVPANNEVPQSTRPIRMLQPSRGRRSVIELAPVEAAMIASTLKVVAGGVTYLVDDPRSDNGIKASISVVRDEATEGGPLSRILHCDRINLDRAKERQAFAAAASTDPAHLIEVRSRLLDPLTPDTNLADDTSESAEPEVVERAMVLLDDPTLLTRLGETIRAAGYAGDLRMPKLLYLALMSRVTARPVNVLIGGPSSAGKTFLMESVANCFPAATYAIGTMSERALVYTDAEFEHRHLLISEAAAIHREGVGALIVRSVIWGNQLEYEITEQDADGSWRTRRICKPGPTGLITTSVKGIESELETRILTLTVPDDEQTTRDILRTRGERAAGSRPEEPDLRSWHEAQRWLAEEGTHEVAIPFATTLATLFPAKLVRARRDFEQLITLIEACAILHQQQRERDEQGRIIATETDYRIIYDLAGSVFGAAAAEGVTPAVRETIVTVAALTNGDEGTTVSAHAVATALKLGRPAVSRRLTLALKGGFLVNEEPVKGKPHKLRVGDPLPEEATLPSPESVRTLEHPPESLRGSAEKTLHMAHVNTPTVRVEHPLPSNGACEQANPRSSAETRELFECSNGFRGEGKARVRQTVPMAQSRRDTLAGDAWAGGEEGIL